MKRSSICAATSTLATFVPSETVHSLSFRSLPAPWVLELVRMVICEVFPYHPAILLTHFSAILIGALAYNLAEAIAALVRGDALPSVQFSETSIVDGSVQAVGKSGVRVFETLPTWNGTDLNTLCPGAPTPIQVTDDIPFVGQTTDELVSQIEEAKQAKEAAESDKVTLQAEKEKLEAQLIDSDIQIG